MFLFLTLSTQDNAKLPQQLKSRFKRIIEWNKCQPKVSSEWKNCFLDFLIDPSFQGVNRLFVLSFENEEDRKVRPKYIFQRLQCYNR